MLKLIGIKEADLKKETVEQPYRLMKKSFLDPWKVSQEQPPRFAEYDAITKRIFILGMTRYSCACTDTEWEDFVKNYGPLS